MCLQKLYKTQENKLHSDQKRNIFYTFYTETKTLNVQTWTSQTNTMNE